MVIGPTGAGKTTMTLVLCGHPVFSFCDNRKVKIDCKDCPPNMKIGHEKKSETTRPCLIKDKVNKIRYYDTAGSLDNRGINQDIINCFYIIRLFDTHN